MDGSTTFRQSDNFVPRQLGGELILVPIDQRGVLVQRIYSLNETAAAVWSALPEHPTLEQLTAAMSDQFDAENNTITEDVKLVVGELLEAGIIVTDSPE